MGNASRLANFIVSRYNPIEYHKLATIMFFFDREYTKLTMKPFTEAVYVKAGKGVMLFDVKKLLPDIKWEDGKGYYKGWGDNNLPLFENQLLAPILNRIIDSSPEEIGQLFAEDAIWREMRHGRDVDWFKYQEPSKDSDTKTSDHEVTNYTPRLTSTQSLVDFIVGMHNPISHEKLLAVMFFFDVRYVKVTTNPFTGVQYIKTENGVSPKQMLTIPSIKYENGEYYFTGDNFDTLNVFEKDLLRPIFELIDKTDKHKLINLYKENRVWCETSVEQVIDWNKYREMYKNSGPKILDPELHNQIMKLKIDTTPTHDGMPLVNDIDINQIIKEINSDDSNKEKLESNLKNLEAISRLEKNWNLYGADPIPLTVVDKARNLLYSLSRQPDHISPIAGGGVQFEFHKKGSEDYLEFEITDDYISYYIEIPRIEQLNMNPIIRYFYRQ